MKEYLPILLGAGIFDSKKQFGNKKKTQPRKVECYELELFFENEGCSVINGRTFPIKRGNILFAKPGDLRQSILPFKCKFLHFDNIPAEFKKLLSSLPSVFTAEDFEDTDSVFTKIIKHYFSANAVDNITACAELILLLKSVSTHSHEENSIAVTAKRYINSNYKEDLSVEHIAAFCNVSTSYLHKIYSSAYGIGPSESLLNRRIYKARDLLVNSNLPLSEIAAECGFNSQSYFSDCFKRKVGITPKEFRNNSSYK